MVINTLLEKSIDKSLPCSRLKLEVPCEFFTLELGMVEEDFYHWITSSDLVESYSCSNILEGIAHDVVLELRTNDGSLSLLDVK